MIRRFILFLIFYIFIFAQAVFAQEIFRVTSVNFDTSNSLIFLTSPDNTTETMMKDVKLVTLENPKRVYFDINSAILTTNSQSWIFNSGGVKQIKVGQFSLDPKIVRVALYLDEDFDQSKIHFLKVNNNIVIQFKDKMCEEGYFQTIYRDEKTSSRDFYESLSIMQESVEKQQGQPIKTELPSDENKQEILSQIQEAFNSSNETKKGNVEELKKELKLKSKYYLNLITPKENGFLLSGFGAVGIEKPMYLTEPSRVVFDIPNAIVNPDLKNKKFKIGKDEIRIGQFETNKVRIVIELSDLAKYYPIFSSDGQSILFLNSDVKDLSSLFTKTNDAVSYYVKNIGPLTDEFVITFNAPVIHSIVREDENLTLRFYNTYRYNEGYFRSKVDGTNLADMKINLLPKVGMDLTLPLKQGSIVNCFLGADGKSVKIFVKGVKEKKKICLFDKGIFLPQCKEEKSVLLDPGHGGADYGAIRGGINEKDINLDIIKRVQAILASKGVTVYTTRDDDKNLSLEDRTNLTAKIKPDIFVSVHVNSSVKEDIYGLETHYYHQESLGLAQTIHASLISYVKAKDRGLFKSKFYVINHTDVPAVLIEVGFISNNKERAELVGEKRKQKTAEAIADGILQYLGKF